MLVREIMTETVVTAPCETTLRTGIERMGTEGIGSLIITREGEPAGIVTATDAMEAGAVTDRSFGDIELREVASSPLVTAGPRESVRDAVTRIRRKDVTKLPVVEGIDVVGVVTTSDVIANYNSIVKQAQDTATDRDRWDESA